MNKIFYSTTHPGVIYTAKSPEVNQQLSQELNNVKQAQEAHKKSCIVDSGFGLFGLKMQEANVLERMGQVDKAGEIYSKYAFSKLPAFRDRSRTELRRIVNTYK